MQRKYSTSSIVNVVAIILSILSLLISLHPWECVVVHDFGLYISGDVCNVKSGDTVIIKDRYGDYVPQKVSYIEEGYVYFDISENVENFAYLRVQEEYVYKSI